MSSVFPSIQSRWKKTVKFHSGFHNLLNREQGFLSRLLPHLSSGHGRLLLIRLTGLRHPVLIDTEVTIDALGRLEIKGLVHSRIAGEFQVTYSPDFNLEPALTHPLTPEQIELHVKKSKDTPFTIRNFTVHSEGNWFLPIARLNYVRREFLKIAEDMMVARARPAQENIDQSSGRWNEHKTHGVPKSPAARNSSTPARLALGVYADSIEGVQGALEGGCDFICFEPVFNTGHRELPENFRSFPF